MIVLYFITATGMILHFAVFLYYIYIAANLPQTLSDRQLYYTTSIIPLVTVTFYGFNIINYVWHTLPIDAAYLNIFFIEWSITNPLFITNLTRVIPMKLPEQLFLTIVAILTNVFGYMSHNTDNQSTKLAFFCVAAFTFFTMSSYLVIRYKYQSKKSIHSHSKRQYNYQRIYKTIVSTILTTWSIYPILFITYTYGYLTHENCAISFVCMDLVSKTLFTALLIGYQENHYRRNSILSYFTRKASRVLPVDSEDIASNYYDTENSIRTIATNNLQSSDSVRQTYSERI